MLFSLPFWVVRYKQATCDFFKHKWHVWAYWRLKNTIKTHAWMDGTTVRMQICNADWTIWFQNENEGNEHMVCRTTIKTYVWMYMCACVNELEGGWTNKFITKRIYSFFISFPSQLKKHKFKSNSSKVFTTLIPWTISMPTSAIVCFVVV